VVRAFRDPAGESTPLEDLRSTIQDLVLADLEMVERRLERLEAGIGKGQKGDIPERDLFLKFRSALEEEKPLRVIPLEDEKILRGYSFLTAKPLLIVFNIGEEEEFSPGKDGGLVPSSRSSRNRLGLSLWEAGDGDGSTRRGRARGLRERNGKRLGESRPHSGFA
jgi:hypothetical protein